MMMRKNHEEGKSTKPAARPSRLMGLRRAFWRPKQHPAEEQTPVTAAASRMVRQRRAVFFRGIAMAAVLGLGIVVAVYSWFVSSDEADIDGVEVTITSDSPDLEFSMDNGSSWVSALTIPRKTTFLDVTGDGITLKKIKTWGPDGYRLTQATWEDAVPADYISLSVKFRTRVPATVYLGENSEITPHIFNPALDLFPSASPESMALSLEQAVRPGNPYNASALGSFSRDAVVGAVRFAIVSENTRRLLWIPYPNVYLNVNDAGEPQGLTETDVVDENENIDTTKHTYWNTATNTDVTQTPDTLSDAAPITIATANGTPYVDATSGGTWVESEGVVMKLWIEGQDSESHRALAGGRFNMSLVFSAKVSE